MLSTTQRLSRVLTTILLAIFLLFTIVPTLGQQVECGFDHLHQHHLLTDPVYQSEMLTNEQMIQNILRSGVLNQRDQIFTIPVVVHVIHKGEPLGSGTNISNDQVNSAITALNEDYRKIFGTNGYGNGVDTEIEFCLAVRDPDNNPHSGINRVDGSVVPLYDQEGITAGQGSGANEMDIKNLSRWPNGFAYNIWVVSEIEDNDGGAGIQGYAYFPTTNPVDGTVILFNSFGTVGNLKSYTNMGRTLTHELGHGLNLYHTFQGGSCSEINCNTQGDRVCDTPPTVLNSNCNNPACGGTQQVENYLDYTSQTCKDMFTQGQTDRMRAAALGSVRSPLLESVACIPLTQHDIGIANIIHPSGDICSNTFDPIITLTNYGSETITSVEIVYGTQGGAIDTYNWTGNLALGQSENIALPTYTDVSFGSVFEVNCNSPNGQVDEYLINNSLTSNYTIQAGQEFQINITTDFYGLETTWKLINEYGDEIAGGGPYPQGQIGEEHQYILCLTEGCYELFVYDSYGNGMCCSFGVGGWEMLDINDNIIDSGGDFEDVDRSVPFCVDDEIIGDDDCNACNTATPIGCNDYEFNNFQCGQFLYSRPSVSSDINIIAEGVRFFKFTVQQSGWGTINLTTFFNSYNGGGSTWVMFRNNCDELELVATQIPSPVYWQNFIPYWNEVPIGTFGNVTGHSNSPSPPGTVTELYFYFIGGYDYYFVVHGGESHTAPLDNYSMGQGIVSICLENPLPIELLSFDVLPEENFDLIQWATASETNNDYFSIEISKNATDYNVIKNINGNGNSSQVINYEFSNHDVLNGQYYYRLTQYDFNGEYEVFGPVSVKRNEEIKVYRYYDMIGRYLGTNENNLELNSIYIRVDQYNNTEKYHIKTLR